MWTLYYPLVITRLVKGLWPVKGAKIRHNRGFPLDFPGVMCYNVQHGNEKGDEATETETETDPEINPQR